MANATVTEQLDRIIRAYKQDFEAVSEKVFDSVVKDTVSDLKNTSPRRTGAYANSWTSKKTKSKLGKVVYNRNHGQLTHLLNNGHIVRNKYGTYGRVNGDNHIGKAEERASVKLIAELRRQL